MLWILLACLPSTKDSPSVTTTTTTDSTTTDTETTDTETTTTATVTDFKVKASAKSVTTRDPLTFTATVSWSDGTETDVTADATWSSSDPTIIRVNPDGKGVTLAVGTATLQADYEEQADAVDVEVTKIVLPQAGEIVINELLADATGDPNGDGVPDPVDDEFVELANHAGITMDISGLTLVETGQPDKPRHTFAEGTILPPDGVRVVFGGGTPTGIGGKHCEAEAALNADSGLELGLALNNEGDTLSLLSFDGTVITELAYGTDKIPAADGASLVLDPEITGTRYLDHRSASGTGVTYSPCTYVDGSPF